VITLSTPACPNCGAPLELMPDRTCRWCHSLVEETRSASNRAERPRSARREQEVLAKAASWTLRPGGPPIDWPSPKDDKYMPKAKNLRNPEVELLWLVRDGMDQPFAQELAVSADLDREFCDLVAHMMIDTRHTSGAFCELAEAIALSPGTQHKWAKSAREFVTQIADLASPDTTETYVLGPNLQAWVQSKRQNA
jgi:hypothetical protein